VAAYEEIQTATKIPKTVTDFEKKVMVNTVNNIKEILIIK
jgi:hypothetical protein